MKACVLHAVGDLRYEEVAKPTPKRGEVLLKIRASGICGSDLGRVFQKGTYKFPTIPGHEFSGEIIEVGEGSDASLIGRKAAVFPLVPCKKCDMCEVGQYASCRDYDYFGSRCDGAFAQYICVPVWNLILAEDSLSYEQAAMAEPAAVSLHALNCAGIELGDSVAIFGAGPIGLMLATFAKIQGALKIILLDIDKTKIEFAKKLGYEFVIDTSDKNYVEKVFEITDNKGVDVSIEGAGVSATFAGSLRVAKPLGKVVLMGNPMGEMNLSQNEYWEILRKQLTVVGTWNSSYTKQKNEWQTVIKAMAEGVLDVEPFITHRFDFKDCNKAFEMFRDKTEFFNKIMFIND